MSAHDNATQLPAGIDRSEPFEFTCEHGTFRICDARCEQHDQDHWIRIDTGNPDKIGGFTPGPVQRALDRLISRMVVALRGFGFNA